MIEKINPQTADITDQNIDKIAQLFPQVITEKEDENGNSTKAIDFELLQQHLSTAIVEGSEERYRLDWPGKRASILKANTPITSTLKPDRDSSLHFDTTENLYIEGDNFEVLKILQESYLGKIKMIYIDPPYNTGKDFVYRDNFKVSKEDYETELGTQDEDGGKLFKNTDTNGRFHSDWLSMMYERLLVARDLLTDDGVIFMSIDDNEVHNLRKISDEIFGEENFVGKITWLKKRKGSFLSKKMISITEYCLVYGKTSNIVLFGGKPDSSESQPLVKRTNSVGTLNFPQSFVSTKLDDGKYLKGIYGEGSSSVELINDINIENGIIISPFALKGPFIWGQENLNNEINNGAKIIINTLNFQVRAFKSEDENSFKGLLSAINGVEISGTNEDGYEQLRDLLGAEKILDYPKPINYLRHLINSQSYFEPNSIVLDFFSGSASTAHAVMQQNASAKTSLKYIQVQLPEATEESSEAYKAGYKYITDIGKERIRRAGKKIVNDELARLTNKKEALEKMINASVLSDNNQFLFPENVIIDEKAAEFLQEINDLQLKINHLDIGFRVYKTSESILKEVAKHPNQTTQAGLFDSQDNIKEDASPEDILTAVILDFGLTLDNSIVTTQIAGSTVFKVDDNALVACFDTAIDMQVVDFIAKLQPIRAVFRDACFKDDKDLINTVESRFKQLAANTKVHVI
jgi:adenine-specific DNA-methyltransferase